MLLLVHLGEKKIKMSAPFIMSSSPAENSVALIAMTLESDKRSVTTHSLWVPLSFIEQAAHSAILQAVLVNGKFVAKKPKSKPSQTPHDVVGIQTNL